MSRKSTEKAMLSKDAEIFVQFPEESAQRILHPAKIRETSEGALTIEFSAEHCAPVAGKTLILYFEKNQEFMQQPARIEVVFEVGDSPVCAVQPLGEPTSAESRQCFRVSTVTSDLAATFGEENDCKVLDISTTGFSLASEQRIRVGEFVPVAIGYEGDRFEGQACVQSVAAINGGGYRYGLLVINGRDSAGNLPAGLRKISMDVQRQQLRRLAGKG